MKKFIQREYKALIFGAIIYWILWAANEMLKTAVIGGNAFVEPPYFELLYLVGNILTGIDEEEEKPIAIGFGGGHYCPLFSETILDFSMGHMAAKYVIDLLNQELVQQMVQKSLNPEYIILDGLKGKQRKKVENLVGKTGLEIL